MRLDKWAACLAGVTTIVSTASAAQGQVVTFSDINDAVPSKFAFTPPLVGSASVAVTAADVLVELLPLIE